MKDKRLQKTELGARMEQLRQLAGLSQKGLALAVDVHPSYIGHLETGRREWPSREIFLKIVDVLDTTPEDLLAAAGYLPKSTGEQWPPLRAYLQGKYHLDAKGTRQIADVIELLVDGWQARIREQLKQSSGQISAEDESLTA